MPNNVNWQDLGWTGDVAGSTGIQDLLGQFFTTPGEYTQYFEDYDPTKEQAATQQMRLGQQSAQEQARASLWKQFQQGRQTPGGFGGGQKNLQTSMSGIFKGLDQGREKAQLGLQSDINQYRSDYRTDVMGQIGQLFAGGAEVAPEPTDTSCPPGQHWSNAQDTCIDDELVCAENEVEENGVCVVDPCYGVTCTTGSHCEDGTCVTNENPNWNNSGGQGAYTPEECIAIGMIYDGQGGCEWSDVRLKTNINLIDTSKSGINIYEYNYKWNKHDKYRGVMAQEILESHPNAITKRFGYYAVDYNKIDVNFERI